LDVVGNLQCFFVDKRLNYHNNLCSTNALTSEKGKVTAVF